VVADEIFKAVLARRHHRNKVSRMKNPIKFMIIQRFVGPYPLKDAVMVLRRRFVQCLEFSLIQQ